MIFSAKESFRIIMQNCMQTITAM